VFTDRRWTKEEPGYTPAASPRLRRRPSPWPPGPTKVASPEVAHPEVRQARTAPSPDPPGSSWWDTLGGFTHRFLAYSFSSCSPGPPPSDGAGHAPALSGPLATLPGTSRIGLPPASPACCDRPAVVVSHPHSNNQRLTAHPDVAPARVLPGHPHHQGGEDVVDWWPHRALGQAAPLRPLPEDPTAATDHVRRHDRFGGLTHEYQQVA
jgi:hypothetical protein